MNRVGLPEGFASDGILGSRRDGYVGLYIGRVEHSQLDYLSTLSLLKVLVRSCSWYLIGCLFTLIGIARP